MREMPIGIIWRYGRDDYQISLFNPTKQEETQLNKVLMNHDNDCTCRRGHSNMSLDDAEIKYWEDELCRKELDNRRKALAHKLYEIGFKKTNVLYDYTADEQLTEKQIAEALKTHKSTAYTLETFLQFCDGSQEDEDHEMFFEASMELVRYMEDLKEEKEA